LQHHYDNISSLQSVTSRHIRYIRHYVAHEKAKIIRTCSTHFLAEYFLRHTVSLCKFLQHLFHLIIHVQMAFAMPFDGCSDEQ